MRPLLFIAILALAMPAHAWTLKGSVWTGVDKESGLDKNYRLEILEVEGQDGGFYTFTGAYRPGFSDVADCFNQTYPLTGYYFEPLATLSFAVGWETPDYDCRTTSAFTGVITGERTMVGDVSLRLPVPQDDVVFSTTVVWTRISADEE